MFVTKTVIFAPPPCLRRSLDAHLSTVATKLQAVSASINAGLEKSMVEIMVSVPRVVTEVQRVEDSIKRLHGELANLSGQARSNSASEHKATPEPTYYYIFFVKQNHSTKANSRVFAQSEFLSLILVSSCVQLKVTSSSRIPAHLHQRLSRHDRKSFSRFIYFLRDSNSHWLWLLKGFRFIRRL